MATQKLIDYILSLTIDTAPTSDDLILTVNAPSGTPANKKVTIGNLFLNAPQFQVSGHSAMGNDAGIDQDWIWVGPVLTSQVLNIRETFTGGGAVSASSIFSELELNPSSNLTESALGGYFHIFTKEGNAKNVASVFGTYGLAEHYGSGTITLLQGMRFSAINNSSGTVNIAIGGIFALSNESVGAIGSAYCLYLTIAKEAGTITNGYGLYIGDLSSEATNAWNIYSVGANSRNQFEGKIMLDSCLEIKEMSAPSGVSDKAIIFAKDNGAGKTQLMVIFPTGVAQQIAIEA